MSNDYDCCFFTKGEFLAAPFSDTCSSLVPFGCPDSIKNYRSLGNVVSATLRHDLQLRGKQNRYHTKYNKAARFQVKDVLLEMVLSCPSNKNIEDFLFSESTNLKSGSETKHFYEFCGNEISKNKTLVLGNYKISNLSVEVVNHDKSSTSLIEGQDYVVEGATIVFLRKVVLQKNFKFLQFNYDYDDSDFQSFTPYTEDYKPLSLFFKGTNYADLSGTSIVDVELFKFTPFGIAELDVIQETEFLTFNLQGRVNKLYDDSSVKSFYKIKKGVL